MKKIFLTACFLVFIAARMCYTDVAIPFEASLPYMILLEPMFALESRGTNNLNTLFWTGVAYAPTFDTLVYINLELATEIRYYILSTNSDGWFAGIYGGFAVPAQFGGYYYIEYASIGATIGVKTGWKFAFDIIKSSKSAQRIDLEPYVSVGTSVNIMDFYPSVSFHIGILTDFIPFCFTAGLRIIYELS